MATVNIGNIKFNWKGPWSNSTTYAVDDVVSLSGSSYISIQAGSNQNPASASAYWQQMSSAGTNGTNGTDVGTTLTTQGDILYRDGSGLQRLPKGTANQVLKMNSGATAPEYGTLSSDFVKLGSGDISSAVSSFSIDGYYTSDYDVYKIFVYNLVNSNSSCQIRWRTNIGGSAFTGSVYRFAHAGAYTETNGNTSAHQSGNHNETYFYNAWDWSTDNSRPFVQEMTIFDPLTTSVEKTFQWQWSGNSNNDSYAVSVSGGGYTDANNGAHSGMTWFPQSSTFSKAKWRIYGLKK